MNNIFLKKFNYRHCLCLLVTTLFLLCSVFIFNFSSIRFVDSLKDFGLSIVFYFDMLLDLPGEVNTSINIIPDYFSSSVLPYSSQLFGVKSSMYFHSLVNGDNLMLYFGRCLLVFIDILKVVLVITPFVIVIFVLIKKLMKIENNDYNKDSKGLKILKRFSLKTYIPIRNWIVNFLQFIKDNRAYWVIWLLIWLYNFNVFTIAAEILAFIFYFVLSFDFVSLYTLLYRLFFDLGVMFNFMPAIFWIVLTLIIFCVVRAKIAYMRLNIFEQRNRTFINSLPIVFMICGTMGKKKTTTMTDIALSQEVLFRDKAFELLLENDLKFPYFPWINLENQIKRCISRHSIYNLATCKRFIYSKRKKFLKRPLSRNCFGYDFNRYGMLYNDNLKVVDLWEVLKNYVQLYFIYIVESSLLISNYSIREDNLLSDIGNFPLWNSDFFKRDSRLIDSFSRHSCILDFDSLRLGKKLVEDNKKANSFEFGVVVITEGGKERGNQLDHKTMKKDDSEANPLNDLFNSWLKMVRHSATVDNFPFVRVLLDEQRPESLGADARELCEIIYIEDLYSQKLALPFFSLENMVCEYILSKFAEFYYNYRYLRSDNIVFTYLYKAFAGKIFAYYKRIWNKFGYCRVGISVQNGKLKDKFENHFYYLISKIIYS